MFAAVPRRRAPSPAQRGERLVARRREPQEQPRVKAAKARQDRQPFYACGLPGRPEETIAAPVAANLPPRPGLWGFWALVIVRGRDPAPDGAGYTLSGLRPCPSRCLGYLSLWLSADGGHCRNLLAVAKNSSRALDFRGRCIKLVRSSVCVAGRAIPR
jgi:hypothetical protein